MPEVLSYNKVNFSDGISIEKVLSENDDRKVTFATAA